MRKVIKDCEDRIDWEALAASESPCALKVREYRSLYEKYPDDPGVARMYWCWLMDYLEECGR